MTSQILSLNRLVTLRRLALLVTILLTLATVSTALAKPTGATIDGDPTDWDDATCLIDSGGVDDETSPTRADITEFCAHVDSNYFYVAMAWDNTGFQGGNASTAGVRLDLDNDGNFDFIILAAMTGNPATLDQFTIGSCDASGACTNADDVCASDGSGGGLCTGANSATGTTWDDPFDPSPGHTGNNICQGTDCTTYDSFVELAIPWTLVGLSGPPAPQIFGDFGSYPSGPAQAPKDTIDEFGTGLACDDAGNCNASPPSPGPTAISLSGVTMSSGPSVLLSALMIIFIAVTVTAILRKRAQIFPS